MAIGIIRSVNTNGAGVRVGMIEMASGRTAQFAPADYLGATAFASLRGSYVSFHVNGVGEAKAVRLTSQQSL